MAENEIVYGKAEFDRQFRKHEAIRKAAPEMLKALIAIRDFEPNEVCKDEFAYDRMVESYRNAARTGIAKAEATK